jgi:hypothetical protein
MFRKSSNNPFIPVGGLNSGSFAQIGGPEVVGQRFKGLLGQTVVYDNAAALKASKTSVGTLYSGVYQLVKLNSAVTRGEVVYWDTLANNGLNDYEVTHTVTAPAMFKAGIAICDGTSGEYAWIQIAGLASVLYRAAVTSAILGNLVVTTSATAADCDALADAGAFATALAMKQLVGIAYELPANSSVKRVSLNLAGFLQNI